MSVPCLHSRHSILVFAPPQELQAKLRTVVFDRRTWELRRAKDQAHLHRYYVQDHELAPAPDDRRAHVRSATLSMYRW